MPIKNPPPPILNTRAVASHLGKIARSDLTGPPGLILGASPDKLRYSDPHRNYFVRLDSIINGDLLLDAEPKSWRYLVVEDTTGVGELEVATSPNELNEEVVDRFLAMHHGKSAQHTLDAIHEAESLPEVAKTDFELRFIQVPALYFFAVWLHAPSEDILIPTTNGIKALKQGKAYSEQDVLKILKPRAAKSEAFNKDQEFR